ncbi:MAG: MFS transporter [Propionibacteriaceae bacterium]|nr:MFS transporter [Propionibacteriaceae bacterium]
MTTTATTIQYVVMLGVAALAFTGSFCRKRLKISLFTGSLVLLVVFCFFTYQQQSAGAIFAIFPLLAMCLTPLLGNFIDRKGKSLSLLILGSLLLIVCHLVFAFVVPSMDGGGSSFVVSYLAILVLGASFALVPTAVWPLIPRLVDARILGTAYAFIYWAQSVGLWLFPIIVGKVLAQTNTQVREQVDSGAISADQGSMMYDYTAPLVLFASLGVGALVLSLILKTRNSRHHLGLDAPTVGTL